MTTENLPQKYCSECGEELEVRRGRLIGYNCDTGELVCAAFLVCPNKKWYNLHVKIRGLLCAGIWEQTGRYP